MTDYRAAAIEPEMKQLLSFAEKMARDASRITPEDIESVRSAGFSDRAILDAAHVTGFFSYMNRVVQALGADSKGAILTPAKDPDPNPFLKIAPTARQTGHEYPA
jgi:uncharacterized peroxidase-related enzyme